MERTMQKCTRYSEAYGSERRAQGTDPEVWIADRGLQNSSSCLIKSGRNLSSCNFKDQHPESRSPGIESVILYYATLRLTPPDQLFMAYNKSCIRSGGQTLNTGHRSGNAESLIARKALNGEASLPLNGSMEKQWQLRTTNQSVFTK